MKRVIPCQLTQNSDLFPVHDVDFLEKNHVEISIRFMGKSLSPFQILFRNEFLWLQEREKYKILQSSKKYDLLLLI